MKEDFDYQAMLAGQLYQAAGILPENGSAEEKNVPRKSTTYQSMTENESSPKKKHSLANLGSIALSNHPFMLIMVAMLRLVITFMPIWIAFF